MDQGRFLSAVSTVSRVGPATAHDNDLAPAYDPERARSLLADAGYPGGRGLPELRLLQADPGLSPEFRRKLDERWTGQWQELGVRFRMEWAGFEELMAEAEAENSFWTWGWGSDYPDPDGMLSTFVETGRYVADAEIETLLARARASRDRDARLDLYRAADRILVADETWIVPTVYDYWNIAHRPTVHGIWAHSLTVGQLDDVIVDRSR